MQNLVQWSEEQTRAAVWLTSNTAVVAAPTVVAPNGNTNCVYSVTAVGAGGVNHFVEASNTAMPIFSIVSTVANLNRNKSSSIWVKAGTTNKVVVGNGRHTNWYRAFFDLGNGVVNFEENCRAYIEPYPNGWFRCTVVYITPHGEANATQDSVLVSPSPISQTGSAGVAYSQSGEQVYVWGAQLACANGPVAYTKTEGTIIEYPAPRSAAYQNLVPSSNNIANWVYFPSSNATLTQEVGVTSPSGNPVMRLTEDATAGVAHLAYPNCNSLTPGRVHTFSVLVKKGATTRDWFVLAHSGGGTTRAYFNLTTGQVGTPDAPVLACDIVPMGDGWFLCWSSVVQTNTFAPILYPSTADGTTAYNGDGTSYLLLADAQLVEGFGYSPLTKTTTIGTTGVKGRGPRGYAGRQNLVAASEDATLWLQSAGVTVTGNATAAPDDTTTADRVVWTAAAANNRYLSPFAGFPTGFPGVTFRTGVTYTVSAWVRTDGVASLRLRLPLNVNVTNQESADIVVTLTWQRVSFSATVTGTGVYSSVFVLNSLAGTAADFYIWGLQVTESVGLAPYVPTYNREIRGRAPRSEMGKQNLFLRSQEMLNTTVWTSIGTVTRSASSKRAPDGTMTAVQISDQSAAEFRGVQQSISVSRDTRSAVVSIFVAKSVGTTNPCGFNATFVGGTSVGISFRIDTTTGMYSTGGAQGGLEDYGDWWRIWGRVTNNGTNTSLTFGMYAATSTTFLAGDSVVGTGIADIWGAQVNLGNGPAEYVKTGAVAVNTGTPRRIAPKQNMAYNSGIDGTYWSQGNLTRSAGPICPSGRASVLLTENGLNAVHFTSQTIAQLRPGSIATMCFFAKRPNSSSRGWIACAGNSGNAARWFDLINGERSTAGGGTCSYTITPAGDGWWYITISWIVDAATLGVNIYLSDASSSVTYTGDGVSGLYVADVIIAETNGIPEMRPTVSIPTGGQSWEYDRGSRGLMG